MRLHFVALIVALIPLGSLAATLDETLELEDKGTLDEILGLSLPSLSGTVSDGALSLSGNESSIFVIEQTLRRQLELTPTDASVLTKLALVYVQTGRLEQAIETLQKVIALDPGNVPVAMDIVRLTAETGGIPAARATLEGFAASAPDSFPYRLALIQMSYDTGAQAQARAELATLLEDDLAADQRLASTLLMVRFLVLAGDIEGARATVEEVLILAPTNPEALSFRALFRLDALDLDGALADIAAGLAVAPDHIILLRLAARAEMRAGRPDVALERLREAVAASDYEPAISLQTANALAEGGAEADATALLETAVIRHPESPQLVAALGLARLRADDWTGAEAVAATLRQFGTPDAINDSERIRIAALRGRGQIDEAQSTLEELAAGGADVGAAAELVQGYLAEGRIDKAAAYVDGLLKAAPGNPAALLMRGALQEMDDQPEAAGATYAAVVAALPQSPLAHLTLARFRLRQDDAKGAEAAIRAGLAVLPGDPNLQMPLVEVLVQRSDFEGALALMEGLVKAYPDNPMVANNYAAIVTDHFADRPDRLARADAVARQLRASTIPQFRDTYGWLLHVQGRHAEALDVLLPVAEALPGDAWANYHLGMVYLALGQHDLARAPLEVAVASSDPYFSKGASAINALRGLSTEQEQ